MLQTVYVQCHALISSSKCRQYEHELMMHFRSNSDASAGNTGSFNTQVPAPTLACPAMEPEAEPVDAVDMQTDS